MTARGAAVVGVLLSGLVAPAALAQSFGSEAVVSRAVFERVHERLGAELRDSPFGVPLVVEASVEDGLVRGDVYSLLDHPFSVVSRVVNTPGAWCDMLTLHFNVKSCREDASVTGGGPSAPGRVALRIETARKYYVPPAGRTPRTYWLDVSGSRRDLLRVALTTESGPFGVKDMRIEIFAMATSDGRSFVHLRYAYAPGWFARAATSTFLATLGRRKVGFTVVGTDDSGEPVYVKGSVAAVERNALRYHLALVAYLDVHARPGGEPEGFEMRIARWFELTERYPRQLREMNRDEYVEMKRRERADRRP